MKSTEEHIRTLFLKPHEAIIIHTNFQLLVQIKQRYKSF